MSQPLDARESKKTGGGASFSVGNRISRVIWGAAWLLFARWTPPPLHRWRAFILRRFGARVGPGARIYASAKIWLPSNLTIGAQSVMGPRVRCYNQGHITIGDRVTVSQDTSLCASSHDVSDPYFQLVLRPIAIDHDAWIAAEAFVGPGVQVGAGALLGARAVAMRNLEPWTIYSGNPATPLRPRRFFP